MKYTVHFHSLPFEPQENQVIYIEGQFDAAINRVLTDHYGQLFYYYKRQGLEFIYMPMFQGNAELEEQIRYYAPYLNDVEWMTRQISSEFLLQYLEPAAHRTEIKPSLLYGGQYKDGIIEYQAVTVSDNLDSLKLNFNDMGSSLMRRAYNMIGAIGSAFHATEKCKLREEPVILQAEMDECWGCCPTKEEEDEDCTEMLRQLQETVQRLRLKGVPMGIIHSLIDQQEKLSRMVITENYRIFLPDYGNMEIEMSALPKTLYFFFLLHPEGIILKHLPDHYEAICRIYRQLKPNIKEEKLRTSITRLTNPFSNRIHEVLSLIHYAFASKFDERLATHYTVNGEKGQWYKISLDPELIHWEEE